MDNFRVFRSSFPICFALLLIRILVLVTAENSTYIRGTRSNPRLGAGRTDKHRQLASSNLGQGHWSVHKADFVDGNGNVVKFSGVTWSGFECPEAIVHGLQVGRTYASHLDQMKSLGFLVIRLPFAGQTLLPWTYPQSSWIGPNSDLQGKTSLEVMDVIINAAASRGMKIILDYHRLHLTYSNEIGTWFDGSTPESVWINNWVMLANRYKGNTAVIGADLFNEVHHGPGMPDGAPYWQKNAGSNEAYNFRSATERVISSIRAVEPNWILFMEGMWQDYWWGGNVRKLRKAPLSKPKNKLAYTCHEYGPYVYLQTWFNAPNFPNNLMKIFRKRWGFIAEKGIGPMWVGEFGSFYPPDTSSLNHIERTAFTTLISYIGKIGASWTLAFWNPDSKDTGGVLNNDWYTVNQEKLNLLQPIMHPNFT